MSYEPTNWKTGDVVTSAKLNKLENAVAGNILVINETFNETSERYILDKTWEEIYNVLNNGGVAIVNKSLDGVTGRSFGMAIVFRATETTGLKDNGCGIEAATFSTEGNYEYSCESANEYPSRRGGLE